MMKTRELVTLFIFQSLFLLFISVSFVSNASATLITGSAGTTFIIGNDPTAANGSFKVQVDYSIYDGTSLDDPKGLTSDYQISFVLKNLLGGDGSGETALTVGRLTVFAPDIDSTVAFYTKPASATADSYVSASAGTRAPRIVKFHPQNNPQTPNCVEFIFDNGSPGYLPQFIPGETSKQLIVRTPASNLPATILLEIDSTNSGTPAVHDDVYINLVVPEPCSMAVFGGAFALIYLKRNRKK